ncbi:MAG TPA: phosphoribosylanthranilate isomerase [Candidatus Binatia bacterium]|jgi:phosphoribosylanthranilate isomerase
MQTWVKICGVTRLIDARTAFDAGADAIGINFWAGSSRYCGPEKARSIVAGLPAGSLVFGVFVLETRERIAELVREVGLTGIQLHGGEDASMAEGWEIAVIRAVAATSREAITAALGEVRQRDGFSSPSALASGEPGNQSRSRRGVRVLVDHGSGGGSGKTIDGGLLDGLDFGEAILAGGLTPGNVAASVAQRRPFGVDTAGGVESAPGIKDAHEIEAFVRNARRAP